MEWTRCAKTGQSLAENVGLLLFCYLDLGILFVWSYQNFITPVIIFIEIDMCKYYGPDILDPRDPLLCDRLSNIFDDKQEQILARIRWLNVCTT